MIVVKNEKEAIEKGKVKEFIDKNKGKMKKALMVTAGAVAVVVGGILVYGLVKPEDEESEDLVIEDNGDENDHTRGDVLLTFDDDNPNISRIYRYEIIDNKFIVS